MTATSTASTAAGLSQIGLSQIRGAESVSAQAPETAIFELQARPLFKKGPLTRQCVRVRTRLTG